MVVDVVLNVCHTQGRKEGTVDFHGLYVHEAVRYAKQELESASRRDDKVVRFIVGTSINGLSGVHIFDGVLVNSPRPTQVRDYMLRTVKRKSGQPWKNSVTST
jgi:hypothetical protein